MMNWERFDKYNKVIDKYMPRMGEGETIASQTATAINTLIYKWYNDGDVYDNQTHHHLGWLNDLSARANWIHKNLPGAAELLETVWTIHESDDPEEAYTEILQHLAERYLREDILETMATMAKTGSIYRTDGPFKYTAPEEEEDDDDY